MIRINTTHSWSDQTRCNLRMHSEQRALPVCLTHFFPLFHSCTQEAFSAACFIRKTTREIGKSRGYGASHRSITFKSWVVDFTCLLRLPLQTTLCCSHILDVTVASVFVSQWVFTFSKSWAYGLIGLVSSFKSFNTDDIYLINISLHLCNIFSDRAGQ